VVHGHPLIPLAEIAALSLLAPLFATIDAIFILKEKVGWRPSLADVSKMLPMDFSHMLWTAVVGYIFFAQTPTILTFIGGFMIFAAATYVTIREAHLARRVATEAAILRE